ncbi:hypothetical protein B0H14DRAFT_2698304 [Mycena olivaceomarginata]|nr:hypothetical protein B0H14DRAFT_2698304 [Mycena olivaceomarginata]
MSSIILPGLALVAGNAFPYTLLGLGAASLAVYAANLPNYRRPKFKLVYWKHAKLKHGGISGEASTSAPRR